MTSLSSSILQIIFALFVFAGGMVLALGVRRYFRLSLSRALMLYFWHALFCTVYFFYALNFGGDATMYYKSSFAPDLTFSYGTAAVQLITSFLSQGMGLSFLGCSLFFQIFGFIGLLAFDAALREVTWYKSRNIRRLATLIVLLPSVSFWSSGLGKDSLSFFSTGLALWAALNLKRRWWLLVISILVMLLVRPHMAGMLGLALAASFALQRGVPVMQRAVLGALALGAAAVLVPLGLNYAGVNEDAGAAGVMNYIQARQQENLSGGSSVDISSMSLPVKLFTYLFRPLPVEAHSLFSLAASLENLVLIFLFIAGGRAIVRKRHPDYPAGHNRKFLWMYSGLAWVILAMTTANLGIASRQKWMFAPMLIFLLISVIGRSRLAPDDRSENRVYLRK